MRNKIIGYKLTDSNGQTYNRCQWGENVTHVVKNAGKKLCSNKVLHYYSDPLLAVYMNPLHANFNPKTMLLWECEVGAELVTDGVKSGCKKLTTIKRIPLPTVTLEQRIEIAIRCALPIYKNRDWNEWANDWLSGKDRSRDAAFAAASAASYAADAAASATASAAASAARAAYAATTASAAAYAAATAADEGKINVVAIIHQVCDTK